jgi:hypothetical protein
MPASKFSKPTRHNSVPSEFRSVGFVLDTLQNFSYEKSSYLTTDVHCYLRNLHPVRFLGKFLHPKSLEGTYNFRPAMARKLHLSKHCKWGRKNYTNVGRQSMNSVYVSALALAFTLGASAQSVDTKANASASSNTSVSAGRSGATAQSNTDAQASGQANATLPEKKHDAKPDHSSRHDSKPEKQHGSSAPAATSSASLAANSTVNAVLSKEIDSKSCKPGDEITARASQDVKSEGRVIIPKGSRLVGHVTEARTRGKGESNSALGIAFDHAILKNGQQIQMNSVVQAIAAAQTHAAAADTDAMMSTTGSAAGSARTSGGGLLNAVGSTAGSATGAAGGTLSNVSAGATSTVGSATNVGAGSLGSTLNSTSSGVVGLNNLSLASQVANSTSGSVITSTGKSVRLDSGTQLLLRVVTDKQ